jgi:hypothetical protein
MKRRIGRSVDNASSPLGKSWKRIGDDGGSERSAWCHLDLGDDPALPAQTRLPKLRQPRIGRTHMRTSRSLSYRLFKEGLMAPILIIALMLLGPLAWLLGVK